MILIYFFWLPIRASVPFFVSLFSMLFLWLFTSAAAQMSWPDCIEKDTVIRNAGKALFFDATGYGSDPIDGCYQSDCSFTDKFLVDQEVKCARVCAQLPDCQWWSFGTEDGLEKCWLRTADDGREVNNKIFMSGSRLCALLAPEPKSKWTQGDNECWGAGFTEDMCCDQRYGAKGNPSCWDAAHTFEMCCLGQPAYWENKAEL